MSLRKFSTFLKTNNINSVSSHHYLIIIKVSGNYSDVISNYLPRGLMGGGLFPGLYFYSLSSFLLYMFTDLPSGYCVQPVLALQMTITTIARYYSAFCMEVCNFFMSLMLGMEEEHSLSASKTSAAKRLRTGEKQLEYALIFEHSEANTYKEDLTLAHIVLEEMQNCVFCEGFNPQQLHGLFAIDISEKMKDWTLNPAKFMEPCHLKPACQFLMGICIFSSFNSRGTFSSILEDFIEFSNKLVEHNLENSVKMNYTLQAHFNAAKWACNI